jgi:hypothetical protein
MSSDILRELAACNASDPYRTKAWIPHMRGKWMTVNVPAELWERVQAAAAAAGAAMGDCGNADCNWRGSLSECSYVGSVGPCCPKCREIVEPHVRAVPRMSGQRLALHEGITANREHFSLSNAAPGVAASHGDEPKGGA